MDDPKFLNLSSESVEHFGRIVAAPIVDGDDLEFRVINCGSRLQRLLGIVTLVVAGHQDGDRWPVLDWRWTIGRCHVPFARGVEQKAASHPIPCHHKGITKT